MELRQLGYFVVACQNPNLMAAAAELGIAQSTLSAGLQALEDQFGVTLFRQVGKRIFPQPAALWLFRHAVGLLHLESFARVYMAAPATMTPSRVTLDLDLSFTVGRLSKALGRSVEALHPAHPGVFFDYQFRLGPEDGPVEVSGAGALIAAEACGAIAIDMIDPSRAEDAGMIPLVEDAWVTVSLSRPTQRDAQAPLTLLRMAERLTGVLMRAAAAAGFADRVQAVDADPSKLARLMVEQPQAVFVLPRSMLSNRLGLIDVHVEPLEPRVSSWIGARIRIPHPAATMLVDTLTAALRDEERNVVFHPRLTLRQLRYFQLLHRSGGISAAARAANVTQPAVTAQLRKLEQVLATPLYRLDGGSLSINASGERLRGIADAIDLRLKEVAEGRGAAAGGHSDVLRIGMIPVADSGSAVAEAVAGVIATLRQTWPGVSYQIVEGRTRTLHDWVQNGSIALAIVETANAQTARIPLGHFEPLALVAHVDLGLPDNGSIAVAQLKDLPLVLGGPSFGIRTLLDQAAHQAGVRLRPCIEVESFPLSLALVQHDSLCTVLPPRAARSAPFRDRLTISTLIDPVVQQPLNVIFSGRHTLSDIERAFVAQLKLHLARVTGSALPASAV